MTKAMALVKTWDRMTKRQTERDQRGFQWKHRPAHAQQPPPAPGPPTSPKDSPCPGGGEAPALRGAGAGRTRGVRPESVTRDA
jgi:hypothetical protein